MTIIGILISALIAAGLSLVFRQLDKQNNSMEKVKRYADKRLEDFDTYFDEREKMLAGTSADMEARQLQATAAVNKLNSQIAESEQMFKSLSDDESKVYEIKEKIDAYDKSLALLVEMTQNVEKNLEFLYKQGSDIKGINTRIANQAKTLGTLESNISNLTLQFSKQNNEQLERVAAQISADSKRDVTELEEKVKAQKTLTEDLLAQVKQSISEAYGKAAQRTAELEKEAFGKFSEEAQKRNNEQRAAIAEETQEIERLLANKINDLQDQLMRRSEDIENSLASGTSDLEKKIASRTAEIENKFISDSDDLEKKVNALAAELENKFSADTNELEQKVAARTAEIENKLISDTDNLEKNLSARTEEIQEHVEQKLMDNYAPRITALSDDVTKQIEDIRTSIVASCQELDDRINSTDITLKSKIEFLNETYKNQMDDLSNVLGATLADLKRTADEVKNTESESMGILSTLQNSVTSQIEDLSKKYGDIYDVTSTELEGKMAALRGVIGKEIEECQTKYNTDIDSFMAKYNKGISDLQNLCDKTVADLQERYAKEISDLQAQYDKDREDFQNQYINEIGEFQSKYGNEIAELQAKYDADRENFKTRYDKEIVEFHDEYGKRISDLQEQYDKEIEDLQSRYDRDKEEFQSRYSNDIGFFQNQYNQERDEFQSQYNKDRDEFQAQYKKEHEDFLSQYNRDNDEFQSQYKQEHENFLSQYNRERDDFQTQYNKEHGDFLSQYNQEREEFQSQCNREREEFQMQCNKAIDDFKNQCNNEMDDFQARYKEFFERTTGDATAGIENINATIINTLDSIKESLDSKAKDMQEKYGSLYDTALAQADEKENRLLDQIAENSDRTIESLKNEIQYKLDSLQEALNATVQEVTAEANAAVRNAQDTIDRLNDECASAEERADAVGPELEKRIHDIDNEIAKFDETAKSKLGVVAQTVMQEQIEKLNNIFVSSCKDIDSRIVAADTTYKNKIAEMRAELGTVIADAKKMTEAAHIAEKENKDAITNMKNLIETQFKEISEKFTSLYNSADKDGTVRIANLRNVFESQMNEISEKYNNLYNASIAAAEAKEKAAFEKYDEASSQNIEKYIAKIQEKIDTMKVNVSDTLDKISSDTNETVAAAQNAINRLISECHTAESRADAIAPELVQKINNIGSQIENFDSSSKERMRKMAETLDANLSRLTEQSEARQSSVLSELDNLLASYRKDLEYRLSRLETTNGDIDVLEKDLREAMENAQRYVLEDFEKFSLAESKKHDELSASFTSNFDMLQSQVTMLERRIEELKESSVKNIAAKLQGFEEKFDMDLQAKGNKIDEDILTWKNEFATKVYSISDAYETERRNLESEYNLELKNKIAELQQRYTDEQDNLVSSIRATAETVQLQINKIKDKVDSFESEVNSKLVDSSNVAESYLQQAADQYRLQITNGLQKMQDDLTAQIESFKETIESKQDQSSAIIDTTLGEFKSWKQHFDQALEESDIALNDKLINLKSTSEQKIEDSIKDLEYQIEENSQKLLSRSDNLSDRLAKLDQQTENSLDNYNSRSAEILAQMQQKYDAMASDAEGRARDALKEGADILNNLKGEMKKTVDAANSSQAQFISKMQNASTDMQSQMSEIRMDLQGLKSQMQLYDDAEKRKKLLDEKLEGLKRDFIKLDEYKALIDEFSGKYTSVVRMNDDLNFRVKDFEQHKSKVENLGREYDSMMELAGEIDKKVHNLKTTSDDILKMQAEVQNLKDALSKISVGYERLDQKQPLLERVLTSVDRSFENMNELDERLRNYTRQVESLPSEIKEVQDNVDLLLRNTPNVNEAATKLSSLHGLIEEAEQKIQNMYKSRQGIASSEERLTKLSSMIDEKIGLLGRLTRSDVEKSPETSSTFVSPQDKRDVRALKNKGWTVAEIARSMGRSQSEIELILEMPPEV